MLTFILNDDATNKFAESISEKLLLIIREKLLEKVKAIDLIDGDTLCARFGITKPTLQKWRDRKEIPYIQIDGVIRYDFNKIIDLKETKRKR